MLPVPASKTSLAGRTTRDRVVDAAFHATIAVIAIAMVFVLALRLHG